jgi:hypothetical protein
MTYYGLTLYMYYCIGGSKYTTLSIYKDGLIAMQAII